MNLIERWCFEQLKHLGWLDDLQAAGSLLGDALVAYQQFWGLDPTGELDGPTRRSLQEYRFCALPDVLESRSEEARWRKTKLTYRLTGKLPALTDGQRREATELALSWWSEIIDLQFSVAGDGTADITMGAGAIDGAGGTLAWSELPNGSDRPLQQKYDAGERWTVAEQMSGGLIDLARVICHEVGHALGLGHLGASCLMAPTVSATIRKPQRGDIEAVLALGYQRTKPPAPTPGPPPVPEPPPVPGPQPGVSLTLTGTIGPGSYTLTKTR